MLNVVGSGSQLAARLKSNSKASMHSEFMNIGTNSPVKKRDIMVAMNSLPASP
jgi:hypothetical protein